MRLWKKGNLTNIGVLRTVNPMSLLKNPMILLGLVGFAFVIGMPYLLDTSTSPPFPPPSSSLLFPSHGSPLMIFFTPSPPPKQKLKKHHQHTVDPETRAEFEEQQKKSILNTANRSATTSLQNFDMAAWMAGKTSGAVANANVGAGVASSSSKTGGGAGGDGRSEGISGRGDGAKARRRG